MNSDDSYPLAWAPRGTPQPEAPSAPAEALALALDSYISALTPEEFDLLIQRTRG